MPLLLVLCSCSLTSTAAHAQCEGGQWTTLNPLAVARQESAAAQLGDSVYIAGGLNAAFASLDSVEVLNLTVGTNATWAAAPTLPQGRDHSALVATTGPSGSLYLLGGYFPHNTAHATVFMLGQGQASWTNGPPMPEARGALCAVEHAGRIYAFGGIGPGGVSTSTFILDPATNQWTNGATMLEAREHLNAVSAGDFIYLIGGRIVNTSTGANHRYDPVANAWSVMAPMPTVRSALALSAVGTRIVAAGGEFPRLFADVQIYDTLTNTWSCRADMPVPRHGVSAVTVGPYMLVPGGGLQQGLQPATHVDRFALSACLADFDLNGTLTPDDVADYIGMFFNQPSGPGPSPVDFNADGLTDPDDLADYITAYFAGC